MSFRMFIQESKKHKTSYQRIGGFTKKIPQKTVKKSINGIKVDVNCFVKAQIN